MSIPMTGATGVEAVNIARLLGWDDMLPLALLLCCSCADPLQLRNGVKPSTRGGGTVVRLSDGDYLGCVQAIPALNRTLHLLAVRVIRECVRTAPVRGCTTPGACKKVLTAMGNGYLVESVSGPLMDGFVWFQYRSSMPKAYTEYAQAVCDKCFLRMVNTFREVGGVLGRVRAALVVNRDACAALFSDVFRPGAASGSNLWLLTDCDGRRGEMKAT